MAVWNALTTRTSTLAVASLKPQSRCALRLCQPQSVPRGTSHHTTSHDFT